MSTSLHITEHPETIAGPLITKFIAASAASRGLCRLGVAGGSSPGPTLAWLRDHLREGLARRLVVTLVDERHVPPDSPDSNARMVREAWLDHAAVRFLPIPTRGMLAADRDAFAITVAELGALDVVLLGAGPDGHIASLFPNHPALDDPGPVIAITDSPKPPTDRISLSLRVLENVDHAVLVVTGAAKAGMLARALAGDRSLPLGRYRPRGPFHVVADPAAASLVTP